MLLVRRRILRRRSDLLQRQWAFAPFVWLGFLLAGLELLEGLLEVLARVLGVVEVVVLLLLLLLHRLLLRCLLLRRLLLRRLLLRRLLLWD